MIATPSGDPNSNRESIPVYRPDLSGNETRYVLECMETSWISSIGKFVGQFEQEFSAIVGTRHAVPVANGTVALHLAHHCLGIGPGDEVIVPTFTYIASVNTIAQTGATPVFVECRGDDWLIDCDAVVARITPRTKAIVAVHLYGAVCDMPRLQQIADERSIALVEDCAESLGSTLDGRHTGTFGRVGTFSFFGNKTVTTGEGGMVTTQDPELAKRLWSLRGQGQSTTQRYWHVELGFNYRMTNICAAIGVAQLERLSTILARKKEIATFYRRSLSDLVTFQAPAAGVESSEWLVSFLVPSHVNRDAVMAQMAERGIDTRPVFQCAHHMPMYKGSEVFPVSEDIARRGISLPSYPGLSSVDLERVVDAVRAAVRGPSQLAMTRAQAAL